MVRVTMLTNAGTLIEADVEWIEVDRNTKIVRWENSGDLNALDLQWIDLAQVAVLTTQVLGDDET